MVMRPHATAYGTSRSLEGLFRDNQPARALYLEADFRATVQGDLCVLSSTQVIGRRPR